MNRDEQASAAHLVFRGEVQGVGFRWTARRIATELGLRGYVRNCPDGSVESVIVGTDAVRARFTAALRDAFDVTNIEEDLVREVESFASFEVRI